MGCPIQRENPHETKVELPGINSPIDYSQLENYCDWRYEIHCENSATYVETISMDKIDTGPSWKTLVRKKLISRSQFIFVATRRAWTGWKIIFGLKVNKQRWKMLRPRSRVQDSRSCGEHRARFLIR